MTSSRLRVAAVLVAASATLLALTSCAPASSQHTAGGGSSAPTTHHTTKPKPTTLPPALDTTAPAALLNIPCNSLATPAEVAAFQGPATLITQPASLATGDLADATNFLPVSDYIRGAGGIDCIWSRGPVDHYDPTHVAVNPYIEVSVEFNAAAAWALYVQENDIDGNQLVQCDGDVGNTSICQFDELVGTSTWIEVFSRKSDGPKVYADGPNLIMQTAVAAVKAAGAPAALTPPQTGTPALGGTCASFSSPGAVQTALGIGVPLAPVVLPSQPDYPTIIATWYAAQNTMNDHPCAFESAGSRVQAMLTWIPGGAWAWAENDSQPLADGTLQPLSLTGLKAHDTASIRCSAGNAACVVDLVLGGDWIEATVPSTSTAANRQTAATALAQDIVNTVL